MTTTEVAEFTARWQQWHAQREATLAEPNGWLSLTELHWLDGEPRRYGDLPGRWWIDGDAAVLDPAGAHLTVDGSVLTGEHRFELVNSGPGVHLVDGDRHIEVARRSGYIIRARDPQAEVRKAFRGVPAYAPDPTWRLTGRFIASDQPVPVTVGAVVEGLRHVYESPGTIEFDHDGAIHRLIAFNGYGSGFNVLFTDATSGLTTYAANRSLAVADPDEDGSVVLDFNRAVNLPCAFTDFATCPVPPRENRLPFAVEAGEKLPYERGGVA
jgi:uncharacterized protein (DUF1684 family)